MQTPPETTVRGNNPALVSTKGLTKQPNSNPVETIESIETFDKRSEFTRVKTQQVSTAKYENIETVESGDVVSIVSIQTKNSVETNSREKSEESFLSSKFQRFHQFQRGIVGGVSQ